MSAGAAKSIADIQYGGLYLPLFTLVYLYSILSLPYQVAVLGFSYQIGATEFQIILGISLVGALIKHGLYRSIYGVEGPLHNPKMPRTILYQKFALTFGKEAGKEPDGLEGFEKEFKSVVSRGSNLVALFQSVRFPLQIQILSRVIRRGIRSACIMSVWPLSTVISYGSLGVLYTQMLSGQVDYFGIVLLITHAIFVLGGIFFNWFPTVVTPESYPWIHVPEHQKVKILKERNDIELEYEPVGVLEEFRAESDKFLAEIQSEGTINSGNENANTDTEESS